MRFPRLFFWFWTSLCVLAAGSCPRGSAQAALLLEDAAGFSSVLSPSGHVALYFARICADTPTQLRRCAPGELGTVISRYEGIKGRDWLAIPALCLTFMRLKIPLEVPCASGPQDGCGIASGLSR